MTDINSVTASLAVLTPSGWVIKSDFGDEPGGGYLLGDQAVRVALFGDSTATITASQSPASQDCTVLTGPLNAGAIVLNTMSEKFLLPSQYSRAYLVCCAGVSGETTANMLARDTAAASTTRKAVTDVLDFKPDVIIYRGGSINDLLAAVADDTVYSQHITLLQRMMAGDCIVIDEGIAGYSGSSGSPAAIRASLVSLNARWQAYAADYPGRLYFLGPRGITCDADGNMLANTAQANGYHLSLFGAYKLAQAEAALLAQIFGPATGPRFPGKNLFTNAMFANTGTTGIGTLATGVTSTASNCTRQNGTIQNVNGKRFQTLEYRITSTAAQGTLTAVFDPTSSAFNVQPGDIYGFEFDFLIAGGTLTTAPPLATGIQARMKVQDSGGSNTITIDQLTPTEYQATPEVLTGKAIFGPFQFQLGSSSLSPTTTFQLLFKTDINDGSVFMLGIADPRHVKLTKDYANLGNTINTVSNAAGQTVTATQIAQGVYIATTRGAGTTDTTDTAANLYSAIQTLTGYQPAAMLNTSFKFRYINGSANAVTIAGGAGVTLSGTGAAAVAAGVWQDYILTFPSTTAVVMAAIGKGTYA